MTDQTTLYDTDIVTWSERQADLLRRMAAGEVAKSNELDWQNIIEEIEDVGQRQIDAIESLLYQAILHMLKAEAWPLSLAVPHWEGEARSFRVQAKRKFRRAWTEKFDVSGLYADALRAMPDTIDGVPPLPVDPVCRVTLDELLDI